MIVLIDQLIVLVAVIPPVNSKRCVLTGVMQNIARTDPFKSLALVARAGDSRKLDRGNKGHANFIMMLQGNIRS